MGKTFCQYCEREISNHSIKKHLAGKGCKKNFVAKKRKIAWIDYDPSIGYKDGTRTIWNKGLTKKTDARIKKIGESFSKGFKNGSIKIWNAGISLPEKMKKSISLGMQKAVAEGRQKTTKPGGICRHYRIKDSTGKECDLQGSWEFKVANFLNDKKIYWERNRTGFKYLFDGKQKTYFPDFYLKDYDLYTEVKGYETEKDRAKWKQFKLKLSIIKKEEMKDLSKWLNSIIGEWLSPVSATP